MLADFPLLIAPKRHQISSVWPPIRSNLPEAGSGPRDEAPGFPGFLRVANYTGAKQANLQRAKGSTEILTFALFQAF